jgi:hypothetical protein
MTKYTGGMKVNGGYYWNPRSWSVEVIPTEGGRLPAEGAAYVKLPFPLLFVVVPLLGAMFLVFLPFIGFGMVAYAIVKRLTGGVKATAADLAATVSPGWAPGEAHLTGKPGEEKKAGAEGAATPELEKLEKEIAEKRSEKK